jgi:hypothetical protein
MAQQLRTRAILWSTIYGNRCTRYGGGNKPLEQTLEEWLEADVRPFRDKPLSWLCSITFQQVLTLSSKESRATSPEV